MQGVADSEAGTHAARHGPKMVSGESREPPGGRARLSSTQRLDQHADLDADGARGGAQTAGGAGVDSVKAV